MELIASDSSELLVLSIPMWDRKSIAVLDQVDLRESHNRYQSRHICSSISSPLDTKVQSFGSQGVFGRSSSFVSAVT